MEPMLSNTKASVSQNRFRFRLSRQPSPTDITNVRRLPMFIAAAPQHEYEYSKEIFPLEGASPLFQKNLRKGSLTDIYPIWTKVAGHPFVNFFATRIRPLAQQTGFRYNKWSVCKVYRTNRKENEHELYP